MDKLKIIDDLISSADKISYNKQSEFDKLEKRTKMIIRKFFGEDSHYLEDIDSILYTPLVITSSSEPDWKGCFESGLERFRTALKVMREDLLISSNYDESSEHDKIIEIKGIIKEVQEIKVMIASPSDVALARELLLDKLETIFRREHFEEKCGKRIIVEGWESLASQSGYPQDIVNRNLLSQVDIVIAIFRHRLGTPIISSDGQKRSESGTAEELLYAIRNKEIDNPPLGMAYFYSNAPKVSLDSIDFEDIQSEWKKLKCFRDEIKNEILYKSYKSDEEILPLVCKDLYRNIIDYFNENI